MKQGSTFVLVVHLQLDMSYVKSIIFTLKNKGKILTKENWSFEDGKFKIPFTQEETVQLDGRTLIEAQINFKDGNVAKSEIKEIFIKESLATRIVEGNKATEETQEIGLAISGDVVYTDGVGGGDYKLPIATESTIGGVKPLNKTKEMTLEVGVDKEGRLFAKGKDITVDSELSEESTNPIQNKVITAEVIALRERNAELEETIEKLQIKTTTEPSPFHNITDSANMKVVDFGMEGKTEQNGTPTPDNPVEIINAGVYNEATGRYEIGCKIVNTNILDTNALQYGYIKTDGTVEVVNWMYYTDYIPVITNAVLNLWNTCSSSSTARVVAVYDKNKNFLRCYMQVEDLASSIQYNLGDNACYVRFNVVTTHADKAMATLNLPPTEYLSYQSQPFTITSDRPITKWDKLVKRDGVWGWSVWSYEDLSDGSDDEAWRVDDRTTSGVFFIKTTKVTGVLGLTTCIGTTVSDCFIEKNPQGDVGNYAFVKGTNIRVGLLDNTVTTVEDFRAFIAEHPFKILYKTNTEQAFIPLPDEEQTLLNNLETYYGVTNVYNEQGCPMWLTYVNDTKLYVDKRLLEIQQAMI